jgi:ABC-type proline/glycine betaine transport system substrate-binding protein
MKISFYISVAASALCLVLSIVLFWVGTANQTMQTELQKQQGDLQKQQEEINKGDAIQRQVGPNLLNDMASVSTTNSAMKELLKKYGYEVKVNTPAPSAGGAAPAPARTAPPASSDAPALRP